MAGGEAQPIIVILLPCSQHSTTHPVTHSSTTSVPTKVRTKRRAGHYKTVYAIQQIANGGRVEVNLGVI